MKDKRFPREARVLGKFNRMETEIFDDLVSFISVHALILNLFLKNFHFRLAYHASSALVNLSEKERQSQKCLAGIFEPQN